MSTFASISALTTVRAWRQWHPGHHGARRSMRVTGAPPPSYPSGGENTWGTPSMAERDMTLDVETEDFTDDLSDEALDRVGMTRGCPRPGFTNPGNSIGARDDN